MSNVGSVLGNLLYVTVDVVDALAAKVKRGLERQRLVLILVLVLVARVVPDHDAVVTLDHVVLLELDVALVALLQVRAVLAFGGLFDVVLVLVLLHALGRHVLGRDHTVARLALKDPPVEGTLYAVVLHFAAVAQVGAHVRTVRVQCVDFFALAPENHHASATIVKELDLIDFEFVRVAQSIPTISILNRYNITIL
jgi:hypothetical protein